MNTETYVTITLNGHVDDLYTLGILFPEGAFPGLHVITEIKGAKEGKLDRVQNADHRETFLTGSGCLPILDARGREEAGWIAHEIIAPLNGYAALADSNFRPAVPMHASWKRAGCSGGMDLGPVTSNRPTRLITANWHPLHRALLKDRVTHMRENRLAAHAAAVISGTPSWADYYRLLEDIAGHRGTTLDKLPEAGLAKRQALNGFKEAANNRAFGRHGTSKRDMNRPQDALMNLLEAREFVRRVVITWLDLECGGTMPRDRVDGGPLRFGLDDRDT